MLLSKLGVQHVRNLVEQQVEFCPGVNLILGPNGSGKSSLLESIYLLGYGRSFRSAYTKLLIQFNQSVLAISAEIQSDQGDSYRFVYQKTAQGKMSAQLNHEAITFIDMIRFLPIQMIHPESFEQIYSGALPRRKILDWGMFHVEPSFGRLWVNYQQVLKQRNSALKQALNHNEIKCWDVLLSGLGAQIEHLRQKWMDSFLSEIQLAAGQLLPDLAKDLVLSYKPGWRVQNKALNLSLNLNLELSLSEALASTFVRDKLLGVTQVGPHRADLSMRYQGFPVEKVLSRGQQKLLMMAIFMAQARWLKTQAGKKSLLLIDDIISELDNCNIEKLLAFIQSQQQQVLISTVDQKGLNFGDKIADLHLFYLKKGKVEKQD